MLNSGFPTAKDLIMNEVDTLKYLRGSKPISEYFPEFAADSNNSYIHYTRSKKIFSMRFESFLTNLQIENKSRTLHIGMHLQGNAKNKNLNGSTYYVAVCENDGSSGKLLRKFHFDYTLPNKVSVPSQPIFHMQYCGKLSDYMKTKGLSDTDMHPWLSVPRIYFTPVTLSILLNLIFKEYPSEKLIKITADGYWRHIVRRSEDLVMKPYYNQCYEFIRKRDTNQHSNLLTSEYFYPGYAPLHI